MSEVKAKSLTFIHGGTEEPKLSLCLESGEHMFVKLRPAQVALLSQECSAYTAERVRRAEVKAL